MVSLFFKASLTIFSMEIVVYNCVVSVPGSG